MGEDANSVRCLFGWAGMSMLISGCQRRGKRSIAILNVPCRGSISQCPRVVGAAAAAAIPLVIVQLNSGALTSLPCERMNSAVCRLPLYLQALLGPCPPSSSCRPLAATQLNFPRAERQFNSGLQLSAFSPSCVGLTASSLSFITFLFCKSPAASDLCVCACARACACASRSRLGTGYLHAVKGLNR